MSLVTGSLVQTNSTGGNNVSYVVAMGYDNVTSILFFVVLLLRDVGRPDKTMREVVHVEHGLIATRNHYFQRISG